MRTSAPFQPDDLDELGGLLESALDVVCMHQIAIGRPHPQVIGLRHDVDNVFAPALEVARWEARWGYQSTFFVLHDSPYWNTVEFRVGLEEIASLGHEVGIHANAIAVALRDGGHPDIILDAAITRLRAWGHDIKGVAAHGDMDCYRNGEVWFVNDEQFVECERPEFGDPRRTLAGAHTVTLDPRPLADFGLEYESLRCAPRAMYLSDSGGQWNVPFQSIVDDFPSPSGQLHILWHPDWWAEAFTKVPA